MKRSAIFRALVLTGIVLAVIAPEQTKCWGQNYYSERNDETFLALALKKQKNQFELSKLKFEQTQALFKKGLVSGGELDVAKTEFSNAKINYQQAMLRVIFDEPYLVVESAVKFEDKGGAKHVRVRILNSTSGVADYEQLVESDLIDSTLRPDAIRNVFVSLVEAPGVGRNNGPIIGQPYETKIGVLPFGDVVTVDFLLLKDVDEVVLSLTYARRTDYKYVRLQKDSKERVIAGSCPVFSQEADLGGSATYPIRLERFSQSEDVFRLAAMNLPATVTHDFIDASVENGQRLSQVNFTQGVTSRDVFLRVYLPDRTSEAVSIGVPISFQVLAVPADDWDELLFLDETVDRTSLRASRGGDVRLEITPRGVARLELRAVNFYFDVGPEEMIEATVEIVNDGTRRIDNARVAIGAGPGWIANVDPSIVDSVEPGEAVEISVRIAPPQGVVVGDYEMALSAEAVVDNRPIEAITKTLRIHVHPHSRIGLYVILFSLFMIIVLGVGWAGVHLSRR